MLLILLLLELLFCFTCYNRRSVLAGISLSVLRSGNMRRSNEKHWSSFLVIINYFRFHCVATFMIYTFKIYSVLGVFINSCSEMINVVFLKFFGVSNIRFLYGIVSFCRNTCHLSETDEVYYISTLLFKSSSRKIKCYILSWSFVLENFQILQVITFLAAFSQGSNWYAKDG